ncbi:MAG: glycosyltransferase [[Actinobacillus] rossii]|nr:glycosyltransferase [[Actinobacillus] rossii]
MTATLGRVKELETLLDSLANQTYKNFELIIIDQNEHFEIEKLVALYESKIDIKYIRSSIKGLSYNRNIGLKACSGEIIGFPDDDCFYSIEVLDNVYEQFRENDTNIVLVEAVDPINNSKYIIRNTIVGRDDLIKYGISYNVFLSFRFDSLFDESLGVGTYFSSGEETDFLWEYTRKYSDKISFAKKGTVYHICGGYNSLSYEKAYKYGLGFGAIFKKEIFLRKNYKYFLKYLNYLVRSLGGIILTKNKRMYLGSLLGRIVGFIRYKV